MAIGAGRGYPGPFGGARWQWLRRLAYSRLDTVVVQTNSGRNWLQNNIMAKSVVTIPNWVDLPLPEVQSKVPVEDLLPADANLLLAAGRIEKSKGFDRLILAFDNLARKYAAWKLVIVVGGGG